MSLGSFIRGLFSSDSLPQPKAAAAQPIASEHMAHVLADWPLPEALPFVPSRPTGAPIGGQSREPWNRAGIQVFAYPFDDAEIAEILQSTYASPEEGNAKDGKYCELPKEDGATRYVACREFIEALKKTEASAGRGFSRLRLVALDRFGYAREADGLFREFEQEMGAPMAAMGFARMLMLRHAERALEVLKSAKQRGIGGAALAACHARVAFACGLPSEGAQMAAEALRSSPDPLWMAADHFFSWGLLRGAALAGREDSALREDVLAAIRSLCEGQHSSRRALACAGLAEAAGDEAAAARYAANSLQLAQGDREMRSEAASFVERLRSLPALVERLSQPSSAMDTSRANLNVEGWSLDEAGSSPARSRWRDRHGDEIILTAASAHDWPGSLDVARLRDWCRRRAESHGAGLVEATVVESRLGLAVQMIYKKLQIPAFTFTGVQITPLSQASVTWEVIAVERGTTGVREATITAALIQQGRLTPGSYANLWARDPYDPVYEGVERSTLRYISDDVSYDAQFPGHPLSKVRRLLRALAKRADLSSVVQDSAPN